MPSLGCTQTLSSAMNAHWNAVFTQVLIFSAQSALAPSQSMPVTSPSMLLTA